MSYRAAIGSRCVHMCVKITCTVHLFCCEKTSFDSETYVKLRVSAMLKQAEQSFLEEY